MDSQDYDALRMHDTVIAPHGYPSPTPGSGASHPQGDPAALIELIRASVIGDDEAVAGPFGAATRDLRRLHGVGAQPDVHRGLPARRGHAAYANTHTESSGTGLQTTRFREDARRIIRDAVGGDDDEHAVIFCGSGSTGAVDKLVGVLNLRLPADLDDVPPVASRSRPTSGRSSSSAPTSTTPTSCRGASRSRTW